MPEVSVRPETTRGLVARIGTNSAIYAIGNGLARATPLVLVPIFTRVLTTADYGIIAVATAVGSLLGILFSLSLESAITTLYFELRTPEERARLNASLL